MCRLTRIKDDRGFTLIESILQLMIFVVFIHLVILFVFWKEPIERQYNDMLKTDFELFVLDLQASIVDVEDFQIHDDNRGIRFLTTRGRINIEYRRGVIRKRIDELGHIPLLTEVETAQFNTDGTRLFVDVIMLDGTRKERIFAIGANPK